MEDGFDIGAGSAGVDSGSNGNNVNPDTGDVQVSENVSTVQDAGAAGDFGLRNLRENYDRQAETLKEWESLGDRQAVQSAFTSYNRQLESVQQLGAQYGYSAEEIQTAFTADPVGTISFLIKQQQAPAQQTQQQQALPPEMQAELDKRIGPLQEAERQRQIAESSRRYDETFDQMFKDQYPNGSSEEVKNLLYSMVSSRLSQNRAALQQIYAGKYDAVATEIKAQKELLLKAFASTGQDFTPKTQQPAPPETPEKPITFDEVMANPDLILKRLKV